MKKPSNLQVSSDKKYSCNTTLAYYLECIDGGYKVNKNTILAELSNNSCNNIINLRKHKTSVVKGYNEECQRSYPDALNKFVWLAHYHNTYIRNRSKLESNAIEQNELLINLNIKQ